MSDSDEGSDDVLDQSLEELEKKVQEKQQKEMRPPPVPKAKAKAKGKGKGEQAKQKREEAEGKGASKAKAKDKAAAAEPEGAGQGAPGPKKEAPPDAKGEADAETGKGEQQQQQQAGQQGKGKGKKKKKGKKGKGQKDGAAQKEGSSPRVGVPENALGSKDDAAKWWCGLGPARRRDVVSMLLPVDFQDELDDDPIDRRLQLSHCHRHLTARLCTSSPALHTTFVDLLVPATNLVFATMGWAMEGDDADMPEPGSEADHAIFDLLRAANAVHEPELGRVAIEPSRFVELWGKLYARVDKGLVGQFSLGKARELLREVDALLEAAETKKEEAHKVREAGNALFKDDDFASAVEHYSKAIKLHPSDPVPFLNRAAAFLRLDKPGPAMRDVCMYLHLAAFDEAPERVAKGLMRLGKALTLTDHDSDHMHTDLPFPIASCLTGARHFLRQSYVAQASSHVRKQYLENFVPPAAWPPLLQFAADPPQPFSRTFPRAVAESLPPHVLRPGGECVVLVGCEGGLHTSLYTLCDLRYRVLEANGCPVLTAPSDVSPEGIKAVTSALVDNPVTVHLHLCEDTVAELARDLVVLAMSSTCGGSRGERAVTMETAIVAVMGDFVLPARHHDLLRDCLGGLVQASASVGLFADSYGFVHLSDLPDPLNHHAQQGEGPGDQGAEANSNGGASGGGGKGGNRSRVGGKKGAAEEGGAAQGEHEAEEQSMLLLQLRTVWLRWLAQCGTVVSAGDCKEYSGKADAAYYEARGFQRVAKQHARAAPNDDDNDGNDGNDGGKRERAHAAVAAAGKGGEEGAKAGVKAEAEAEAEAGEAEAAANAGEAMFHNPTLSDPNNPAKRASRAAAAARLRDGAVPALATWASMWRDCVYRVGEMAAEGSVCRLRVHVWLGRVSRVCRTMVSLRHGWAGRVDVCSVGGALERDGVFGVACACLPLLCPGHGVVEGEVGFLHGKKVSESSVLARFVGDDVPSPEALLAGVGLEACVRPGGPVSTSVVLKQRASAHGAKGEESEGKKGKEGKEAAAFVPVGDAINTWREALYHVCCGVWLEHPCRPYHTLNDFLQLLAVALERQFGALPPLRPVPNNNDEKHKDKGNEDNEDNEDNQNDDDDDKAHPNALARAKVFSSLLSVATHHHTLAFGCLLSANDCALARAMGSPPLCRCDLGWWCWSVTPIHPNRSPPACTLAIMCLGTSMASLLTRYKGPYLFKAVLEAPPERVQILDCVVVDHVMGTITLQLPEHYDELLRVGFGVEENAEELAATIVVVDGVLGEVICKPVCFDADTYADARGLTVVERERVKKNRVRLEHAMQGHPLGEVLSMLGG